MNPILLVAPFCGVIASIVALLILGRTRISYSVRFVTTSIVFIAATVIAHRLIPLVGVVAIHKANVTEAQKRLVFIELPPTASMVDVYSSMWNHVEFASFHVSRDEYVQWCESQRWAAVPDVDSLFSPLFVLDEVTGEIIPVPDEYLRQLVEPYRSTDERFDAAYDSKTSRVLVWCIFG